MEEEKQKVATMSYDQEMEHWTEVINAATPVEERGAVKAETKIEVDRTR